MTDPTDVVQRARQALEAWPGQPITDDDRKVNAVIGSITVAQYDLVTDLLALVEVALPTITTQRDDALAEVADLLKVDHQCAAVDEAWAADRAERDELRATIERVREALGNHPRCDVHPDDLITCGWKRAVTDAHAALDGEA